MIDDLFEHWVRDHIKRTGEAPSLSATMTFIEAVASVKLDRGDGGTYRV